MCAGADGPLQFYGQCACEAVHNYTSSDEKEQYDLNDMVLNCTELPAKGVHTFLQLFMGKE